MNTPSTNQSDSTPAPAQSLPQIEVVAAVCQQGSAVLATQRGYGSWKGWWEFPGGKIKNGESHHQALARELKEELDADIQILRLLTTVQYTYPDFHLTMHCYLCHLTTPSFTLNEHLAARWLTADQLPTVQWLPADQELVQNLFSKYI